MIFQNERDLQIELSSADPSNWCEQSIFFTKREVSIGECIPDMICVGYQMIPTESIWPRKWKSKYSFVLSLLRSYGALSINQIADFCFEETKNILPLVLELKKEETIICLDDRYYLSPAIALIEAEVIAIEAKLKNWREALAQGIRYKKFSDKVIVAMDAHGVPRASEILYKFIESNVGLCAISRNEIEWLVRPLKNDPSDSYDKEYIVDSTLVPCRQILWERR